MPTSSSCSLGRSSDEAAELAAQLVDEFAQAAVADRRLREDTRRLLAAGHGPLLHEALRSIAAEDSDRAAELNGVGFSRYTSRPGHRIAALDTLDHDPDAAREALRICRIHRRQLDEPARALVTNQAD